MGSLTEAAEGACMPVSQIYGLEDTKALMVRFDLDVQIAPNVTQKVHTGWLSPPDDMLLREKMDDGATVAQSSQVLKTFVYREHLVVHTSIPFDRWCQGDCGCVEKGYFGNVQGLTTGGSTNFLQQGGLIAIIVIPTRCINNGKSAVAGVSNCFLGSRGDLEGECNSLKECYSQRWFNITRSYKSPI